MKHLYLFFIFLFTLLLSYGQESKRVYFIGNSYTYYNDLPQLTQKVAQSVGDNLTYESTTSGGASLQDHLYNEAVTAKINSQAWDYVVLQEQSQRPALDDSYTFPYAAVLNDRIKNSSPCAKTLFYMTWGYKNGDQRNCNAGLTHMCTYEDMDDKIYASYMRLTEVNKAHVSPVGRVWREIRRKYPTYELFDRDNSHPSPLGSMAAAYTFYTILYKKDPTLISFKGSLSTDQANNIKRIVKEIVYDDLERWFVGVHYNNTKFEYEITDSATVHFTNTTPNTTNTTWDFGDGTTATAQNPVHTYTETGQYTVTATVTTCNDTYTYQDTITIENLSLLKFDDANFAIYPNPAQDYLIVQTDLTVTFQVYDLGGKSVSTVVDAQEGFYKLDVRHLAKGTYLLRIKTTNGQENHRFVLK